MADEDASREELSSFAREMPAPPGLPEGWKCLEKRYLTGPSAGQTYLRFSGGVDQKHKGVLSVRSAIRRDAEDRGLDPDEEVAKYDKAKQEKAEALMKAKEEAGRLSGAKREEAVNHFREKLGALDGPTAQALRGWRCEFTHSANSNQTHATYIDPEGIRYVSVKDIECCLGHHMRSSEGEILALVKEARAKANPSNFSRCSQAARWSVYSQGTPSIASLFSSKGGAGKAAEDPDNDKDPEEKAEQPGLPSTPPMRSNMSSSPVNGCDGSAEKLTTPGSAPSGAAAAARKLVAGGHAAAAAAKPGAGEAPSAKACPACSEKLEWTDFSGGAYVESEGWQCDNFQKCGMDSNKTGSWWRWLCRKCESDFCKPCFGELPCQEAAAAKPAGKKGPGAAAGPAAKSAAPGGQKAPGSSAKSQDKPAPAAEKKKGEAAVDKSPPKVEERQESADKGKQTPAPEKKKGEAATEKEAKGDTSAPSKQAGASDHKKGAAEKQAPASEQKTGAAPKDKPLVEQSKAAAAKDKPVAEQSKAAAAKDKPAGTADPKKAAAAADKKAKGDTSAPGKPTPASDDKKGAAEKQAPATEQKGGSAPKEKHAPAAEQSKAAAGKDKPAAAADQKKAAAATDKKAAEAAKAAATTAAASASRAAAAAAAAPRATKRFLVDNSRLKASTAGLAFRRSKRLDDKDGGNYAEWGTFVEGWDANDGWLRVGSRFLPTTTNGITVLAPAHEPAVKVKTVKRVRRSGKQRDLSYAEPEAPADEVEQPAVAAGADEGPSAKRQKKACCNHVSGYMVFCKKERQRCKAEGINGDQREVVKELGRRWRNLTEKERSKYLTEANHARAAAPEEEEAGCLRGRPRGRSAVPKPQKGRQGGAGAAAPADAPASGGGSADGSGRGRRASVKMRLKALKRLCKRSAAAAPATAAAAAPAPAPEQDDKAGAAADKQKTQGEGVPAPMTPAAKRRKVGGGDAASSAAAAAAPSAAAGGSSSAAASGASSGDSAAASSSASAGGAAVAEEAPPTGKAFIEDDAPADSPAHQKVKYENHSGAFWFEMKRGNGERVRVQTTVVAAGGCRESAARIARLCYVECEAGADKEQVLQLRAELYKKCGAPPTRRGPSTRERSETYRNLFGEVVVVSTAVGGQRAALKAFTDLEQSDIDVLSSEDIVNYEKEVGLSYRRSQAERLTRLEQMAQRTTLPQWVSGGALGSSARASAAGSGGGDGGAADGAGGIGADILDQLTDIFLQGDSSQNPEYDAKFLQVFLALPPEERQHASMSEITRLERVAHIADGGNYTIAERRSRLKEKLWEYRTHTVAPKNRNASFFKTWLKTAAEDSNKESQASESPTSA